MSSLCTTPRPVFTRFTNVCGASVAASGRGGARCRRAAARSPHAPPTCSVSSAQFSPSHLVGKAKRPLAITNDLVITEDARRAKLFSCLLGKGEPCGRRARQRQRVRVLGALVRGGCSFGTPAQASDRDSQGSTGPKPRGPGRACGAHLGGGAGVRRPELLRHDVEEHLPTRRV